MIQERTLKGTYLRDDVDAFSYEVRVEPTATGFAWTSVVRRDGELRGRPSGTAICPPTLPDDVLEAMVHEIVRTAIRDRVGVG